VRHEDARPKRPGDETPEGDPADGILDQLAKYEKAKIAERRDGLIVHEPEIVVVEKYSGSLLMGGEPRLYRAASTTRTSHPPRENQAGRGRL
jgi:hypothetical protein